jgi:ATP-dependent helicase HrpB
MNELMPLPIDDFLEDVKKRLKQNNQLLLVAEPGAGKTTRVPPALMSTTQGKILVLEPRRIAARSAAERICAEQNFQTGKEVGYQVRFENKVQPETQLIFMSEALLWRHIQKDPILKDIGVVIFDEFHERNIYSDVSLGILHELQNLERPDLKIVVMSATLNLKSFQDYWPDCSILHVPGRSFPIEVFFDSKPQCLRTDFQFINRVCEKIKSVWNTQKNEHSILVFLPGLSEIRRVQDKLESQIPVLPLHGNLSLEDQKKVLTPNEGARVILATNVAESSLTIDGVDTVIDTGLSREITLDPKKVYPLLRTTRISKNSAEQRKGRAGRQYPGRCFKMWSKEDETTMPKQGVPEVLKIDLLESILFLLSLKITNPLEFSWFDEKPSNGITKALQQLKDWQLLNPDGSLNPKGLKVAQWPLPPRLSFLMEDFCEQGLTIIGSQLCALLLEKDPLLNQDLGSWQKIAQDSDLTPRLLELNEVKTPASFFTVEKVAIQLCRIKNQNYQKQKTIPFDLIYKILLGVFTDSLCRRRRQQDRSAISISGQGIELSEKSLLRESEFFISLQGHSIETESQSIVDWAIPIKKQILLETFNKEIDHRCRIELQNNQFFKIQRKYLKNLPLEDEQKTVCKMNEVPLQESFTNYWPELKGKNLLITQWFLRYHWAAKLYPDLQWIKHNIPNSSQSEVLTNWDLEIIEIALMGVQNFEEATQRDWEQVLNLTLTEPQKQILQKEMPTFILSCKEKKIRLLYEVDQISAELKIQDAYGWNESPRIANGKVPLRLILLGPHMRPLQTTSDLASFWRGTYQELRGALKAKYHRHPWPERPWESE